MIRGKAASLTDARAIPRIRRHHPLARERRPMLKRSTAPSLSYKDSPCRLPPNPLPA
ncbi:hypothetical protein PCL1606_49890 [Pseudomonas chlororaphis]|uniref:Uncharacterized protein n=1 Tax=Pseudomonas chlororaphis TaxID=587753 RepID=A0A0D5Y553_9PSED|nr:hypothetical protein PCL1606_49890 [Pseudomonas chlororaphis]